jgi:hypothetical protein
MCPHHPFIWTRVTFGADFGAQNSYSTLGLCRDSIPFGPSSELRFSTIQRCDATLLNLRSNPCTGLYKWAEIPALAVSVSYRKQEAYGLTLRNRDQTPNSVLDYSLAVGARHAAGSGGDENALGKITIHANHDPRIG